ncbi:16S rRNA (adenine(1518)-N(6)/adenine(1519)-N(6))-dimethyltransferase RsmA [Patescibacteria group bacterium]|nr:16S rRNA (adenine(1518)-N(6)/adenine(1519)-N(6))-dimethyltransferase RsmA [Patescibacteria group bacterium]
MFAKKSLGQHFLHSEKALSQIVEAGSITINDVVLEIGPGQGVLTELLLKKAGTVIAVEKDRDLIPVLAERFREEIASGQLVLIRQDILMVDIESLTKDIGTYKLIANIPYYITGAIIEKFLSTHYQPTLMVLLMQKEVADRIIARDKKESILSIAIKAYGVPKLIGKVPPGAFNPPPTVDSGILLIEHISRDFFTGPEGCSEQTFLTVMKTIFGNKRKQIGGTLADFLENRERALQVLSGSSIDTKTRPEDIELHQWKKIAQVLGENN